MNSAGWLTRTKLGRGVTAATLFGSLGLAVILSGISSVAETVAGGGTGRFGKIAPGALGEIRLELAKVGSSRLTIDPAQARQALSGVPLSSDPFAALAANGLMIDPRGQTGREAGLLREALRRDPRSRPARILYLRQLAAQGDLNGAFEQLAVFNRLNPNLVGTIMEAITTRVSTPGQVDDALAAIAPHDSLYLPFVNRMTGKRKSREVVIRLADRLPAKVLSRPDIRRAMVRQLVEAGELSRARQLWQQGVGGQTAGLVHSPDFTDQAALPPFNWQYFVNSTGAAEPQKGGGLSVSYYDRNPGPLASQLLTLSPGTYSAEALYEVIGGDADNVRLIVTCQSTGAILGQGSFIARKPGRNTLSLKFAVPAGCPGQTLAVTGVADEDRGEKQLFIPRIDVRAGGSK